MTRSNFQFLATEWPALFESAAKAEALVYPDARSACFYARRALEQAVQWLYRSDAALRLPYQDHLSALIHEPTFRTAVGPAIFAKVKVIKDLGNLAVHSHKPIRQFDALTATRELFQVMFWLARTYARGGKPTDGLTFDDTLLPKTAPVPPQTLEQLQGALATFIAGKTLRADQIEFLDMIVNHLTEHGFMEARLLYESPYTDYSPLGVDGLFTSPQVDELVSILRDIRGRAAA